VRARHRCHFDQVEPLLLRGGERGVDFHDAHLAAIGRDHAERADTDLPVHADALGRVLNRS
jgi:hypothetical protein